jgi:uncharacterized membrane protein YjjP (DUF1212 family)
MGDGVATATEDATRRVEFLLRFARAGHDAGYSTTELEARAVALAHAVGFEHAEVSVTPTQVELSLGALTRQQTHTLRVRPGRVDLGAIARLDELVQDVLDERVGPADALALLSEPARARALPVGRLAAYAAAGFALTPLLGGGWRDALSAAAVGLVVGLIALPAARSTRTSSIVAPLAAIAAAFAAALLTEAGVARSSDVVTLAALVTLLPGMTLTLGMQELASEQLQSGVANTAAALVQLLGLVFGVEVGRSVAEAVVGTLHDAAPLSASGVTQAAAAILAGIAFTGTLSARLRDAPLMCTATLLALVAKAVGTNALGAQAGVFAGAFAVGLAGALVGAWLRRSPLVFIVPGVLMLAPGSLGFTSALQLLRNETVSGVTAAFDTFLTAGSIAYGLMIAAVVLPRRLTDVTARRHR